MILPWYFLPIRFFLFPYSFLIWCFQYKCDQFHYDWNSDIFTIYGVKYSATLFEAWSKNGLPIGTKFELIDRDQLGIITIREIHDSIDK